MVAVIQARLSSARLPGKVVEPLCGRPMVLFMIERLRRAACIDRLVVATSVEASDDPLAALLEVHGVECVRGSLNDVLARYMLAAEATGAENLLRLTADCPLIDPDVVDRVANRLLDGGFDYVSNINPPTYPDGLDVEAFTRAALQRAGGEARLPAEREHVTVYIRESGRFTQSCVTSPVDLSNLRWTVDHPADLEAVRALAAGVAGDPIAADRFDFLRVLDRDPIPANRFHRNEALQGQVGEAK
jgi:spore coat polysaccharide biosynthesis protein SpsF (cytidylyltransferase family)